MIAVGEAEDPFDGAGPKRTWLNLDLCQVAFVRGVILADFAPHPLLPSTDERDGVGGIKMRTKGGLI